MEVVAGALESRPVVRTGRECTWRGRESYGNSRVKEARVFSITPFEQQERLSFYSFLAETACQS
ncbi:hypothetical protein DPMN_072873 [Dreissena polymorpha]|uniref:Uncharacterized protein n=1 Tax=Dreissena polymorpha TaxID=45954 RepID=A0A9D4BY54_DREPO|nr:hypothetical protein DPMN_072873 [Dreissena polymorpha]